MSDEYIADDELLYRAVSEQLKHCKFNSELNRYELTSEAFRDKNKRPSVDRAKLRNNNPSATKFSDTDGVVSIGTLAVRGIVINSETDTHSTDVEYKPIKDVPGQRDNIAHSEIHSSPPLNGSSFKKLKDKLSRLADENWEVHPTQQPESALTENVSFTQAITAEVSQPESKSKNFDEPKAVSESKKSWLVRLLSWIKVFIAKIRRELLHNQS